MKLSKRGQVEVTFNWVYILIAGAVILLFFISLVVRQKAVSEEHLASDVVRIMESIFTGAQASEKTKSSIPLGGLSEKTFYFDCQDGVGEYGVEGLPARTQNSLDPIFAPSRLQAPRLILWSLPYVLPFKIADFLMVTSPSHFYVLLGEGNGFSDEFLQGALDSKQHLSLNVQKISSVSEITLPQRSLSQSKIAVRLIDTEGALIRAGARIPQSLLFLEDQQLTAVSFTANKEANFFKKESSVWKKLNAQPMAIVSKSSNLNAAKLRDAAKYGAVFTEDPEVYLCNMQKAYRRIQFLAEIYEQKAQELEDYYQNPGAGRRESGNCLWFISGFTASEGNVKDALLLYKTRAKACSLLADSSCINIVDDAERLNILNGKIAEECSVKLY